MSTIDFTQLNHDENPKGEVSGEKDIPDISLRGSVEFKEKPIIQRKFDDMKKVIPYLIFKKAVPEMLRIAWDYLVDGATQSLFGTSSRRDGRKSSWGDVVEYDNYWFDKRNAKDRREEVNRPVGKRSYDEFLFTDKLDVDDILVALVKQARDDGKVSVSDLYFIIKRVLKKAKYPEEIMSLLEDPNFTDNDYGWFYDDLRTARAGSNRANGRTRYFLDLPEAVPIKRR